MDGLFGSLFQRKPAAAAMLPSLLISVVRRRFCTKVPRSLSLCRLGTVICVCQWHRRPAFISTDELDTAHIALRSHGGGLGVDGGVSHQIFKYCQKPSYLRTKVGGGGGGYRLNQDLKQQPLNPQCSVLTAQLVVSLYQSYQQQHSAPGPKSL